MCEKSKDENPAMVVSMAKNVGVALESIVVSYQNSEIAQRKSAQLIFGAIVSRKRRPLKMP